MEGSGKSVRLSKAAREFNIGSSTIVEFLSKKGVEISSNPNTKLTAEMYDLLGQEFQSEKTVKAEAEKIGLDYADHKTVTIDDSVTPKKKVEFDEEFDEVFIKDLGISKESDAVEPKKVEPKSKEEKEEVKVEEEEVKTAPKEKEKAAKSPAKVAKEEKEEEEQKDKKKEKQPEEEKPKKEVKETAPAEDEEESLKVVGKIDLEKINMKTKPTRKTAEEKKKEREEKEAAKKKAKEAPEKKSEEKVVEPEVVEEVIEEVVDEVVEEKVVTKEEEPDNFMETKIDKLTGPKILDKIELPPEKKKSEKKPVASSKDADPHSRKKRRKRIRKKPEQVGSEGKPKPTTDRPKQRFKDKRVKKERERPEITEEDIQKQIKETLAKLTGGGKSKASKYRREKRQSVSDQKQKELEKIEEEKNIIKVTEFVTANELATMMDVAVNEIISTCMSLGLFVSINQRLDAETFTLVAEEFGYEVEFVSADFQDSVDIVEEEDDEETRYHDHPL